jgi:hypothetical protein
MDPKFWRHNSDCALRYWYEIKDLERELADAKRDAWMPIESLPIHTTALCYEPCQCEVVEWHEFDGERFWMDKTGYMTAGRKFTHWLPLPSPPSSAGGDK